MRALPRPGAQSTTTTSRPWRASATAKFAVTTERLIYKKGLVARHVGELNVDRIEGVSVRHASRFLLVGTMNPEEGELRPQLLDRFGLAVDVRASREPDERAEVVRRRRLDVGIPRAGKALGSDSDDRIQ